MSLKAIQEWTNQNQGYLSLILFAITMLVAWMAGLFRWVWKKLLSRIGAPEVSKIECVTSVVADVGQLITDKSVRVPTALIKSPSEIPHFIKKIPPLQREDVAARYHEVGVLWVLEISSCRVVTPGGNMVRLMMLENNTNYPWVNCQVTLVDYPELNIVHEDQRVEVRGVIDTVSSDGHMIELRDCKLRFC